MFCPSCRDEFRAGFTRCANCDVDLVERLDEPRARAGESSTPPIQPAGPAGPMVDACGYLDLDEARRARERLREERIASEILIRDAPHGSSGDPIAEEYWLRVTSRDFRMAAQILDLGNEADSENRVCDECGLAVSVHESFCPGCGTRFGDPG